MCVFVLSVWYNDYMKLLDLIGKTFGRLTVVSKAESIKSLHRWVCSCQCGNAKTLYGYVLLRGSTRSCGCLNREVRTTQGGGSRSSEYSSWKGLVARCTNPCAKDYSRYGGAGITVYDAWVCSFPAFLCYMGCKPTPKHTIDRIDNSLGYLPGNVRWATIEEQALNKTRNIKVLYQGKSVMLAELAHRNGISTRLLYSRVVRNGWSVEKALTTSVRQRPAVSAPFGADTAP